MTGFPRISPAGVTRYKGRMPGFPPRLLFGFPEFLELFLRKRSEPAASSPW